MSEPIKICANTAWCHTKFMLEKSALYNITVEKDQKWYDTRKLPSSPDGVDDIPWYLERSRPFLRIPSAKWFALIGCINRNKPYFLIGEGQTVFQAEQDGELICFANDVRGFYWNNSGSLLIKMERVG